MGTNIFIQARMSSSRMPGKVLAPLNNKPLIKHIVDRAKQVRDINKVVVLTSLEESDDPLVSYLDHIKCEYFRGSLENVFFRFQSALEIFPCDYFVRLSADSPLLDINLIEFMTSQTKHNNYDIISNVIVRTFPKGQSVEIIRTQTFMQVNKNSLSTDECEHVLPFFYRNRDNFNILSVENNENESNLNMCVDTLEDIERITSSNCSYKFCQNSYAK